MHYIPAFRYRATAYIEKPANNPTRQWRQPLHFGAMFPVMDNQGVCENQQTL